MKPTRLRVPSPVHHKASGKALLFLRDAAGKRQTIYLGDHGYLGDYGSPEAERRYRLVLSEHLAGRPVETRPAESPAPSIWPDVAQLCAACLLHAQRYYVDENAMQTGEVGGRRRALASRSPTLAKAPCCPCLGCDSRILSRGCHQRRARS